MMRAIGAHSLYGRSSLITKFDSIYAGHVDMGDIGYAGTAVNDRIFPNEHLLTAFDKAVHIAQKMDGLGYDTLWLAEHHFQPEGYECIPNLLMLRPASCPPDPEHSSGLRVQHLPHVASPAPGRRLRHR